MESPDFSAPTPSPGARAWHPREHPAAPGPASRRAGRPDRQTTTGPAGSEMWAGALPTTGPAGHRQPDTQKERALGVTPTHDLVGGHKLPSRVWGAVQLCVGSSCCPLKAERGRGSDPAPQMALPPELSRRWSCWAGFLVSALLLKILPALSPRCGTLSTLRAPGRVGSPVHVASPSWGPQPPCPALAPL